MLSTAKSLHALNTEEIRGNARNLCSHAVEHIAELLYIRLTGSIIDSRGAFCKYGGHDDIGSTGDRSLVEKHITALEPVGPKLIDITTSHTTITCAKLMEAEEVGVKTTAAYLVATRLCHGGMTETAEQRTYHKHRATESRTFLHELVAAKIVKSEFVGLEAILTVIELANLHTDIHQQLYKVVDIEDIRDILYHDLLIGKKSGADDLKSLILCALRNNSTTKRITAFNKECFHRVLLLLLFLLFSLLGNRLHVDSVKAEAVKIQLYHAVGETCEVVGHLLVVAIAMSPEQKATLHLVGGHTHEGIALLTRLHCLERLKQLKQGSAIVTDRNTGVRICHRLRL